MKWVLFTSHYDIFPEYKVGYHAHSLTNTGATQMWQDILKLGMGGCHTLKKKRSTLILNLNIKFVCHADNKQKASANTQCLLVTWHQKQFFFSFSCFQSSFSFQWPIMLSTEQKKWNYTILNIVFKKKWNGACLLQLLGDLSRYSGRNVHQRHRNFTISILCHIGSEICETAPQWLL